MELRYDRKTNTFWLTKDGQDIASIKSWQALILYNGHGFRMLEMVKTGIPMKLAENGLEMIHMDISVDRPEIVTNVSTAYFSCL